MSHLPSWKPQKLPSYWPESVQVFLKCESAWKTGFGPEVVVRFRVGEEEYLSFVQEHYVDLERKLMCGAIIGELEDKWLIQIPADTLTSGCRISVPDHAKSALIIRETP